MHLLALTSASATFTKKVEELLNPQPPPAATAVTSTPTMEEGVDPSLVSCLDEAVMLAASHDRVDNRDVMFDAVVEMAGEYHRAHSATPSGGILLPPPGALLMAGDEKRGKDQTI